MIRNLFFLVREKYADNFLDKYGERYKVDFIIDNDREKWGKEKRGIAIKSPEEIGV